MKRMKNDHVINGGIYERLKPTGSVIPRLYGLPKILNPGLHLGSILDIFEFLYHSIAKWLVDLESVRKRICIHSLHDTFEFIDYI